MLRLNNFILILVIWFLSLSTAAAGEYLLSGQTMGTFYRIKFLSSKPVAKALWQEKTDLRLKQVNARLSMYQKKSEISRFNQSEPNQKFRLSKDFYQVLLECKNLHTLTQGAWDGTVKPLVDLWGFGTQDNSRRIPLAQEITAALAKTGFDKLILADHSLTKTQPGVTLDLGSIAKGYGVDEIARLFRDSGVKDYLVEIGGELAGSGRNKKGNPWAVGISRPEKIQASQGLYKVISLDNMAIATSGNYRNFFEHKGKTYSHIISPKTGFPVDTLVVSASVIAKNCTLADGLATALMVMPPEKGIALTDRMEDTECLIIKKQGERLVPFKSKGFKNFEQDF
ncbi:MAG: FAD:protein FMN transferase [Desulfobacter sp.]|nr:MAG: FAD:protein FMN transferase [Desulfobacter sp.]